MKQTIKLTAFVIIVLSGMLMVWANKTSVVAKVETLEPIESVNPLYISNCARCHGADGKGKTKLGEELGVPDLTVTARQMSLTRVKNIISNGLGDMPAYKKKLKASQITSLANYVRRFR